MTVRIGTWNVQYGKGAEKNARRREVLRTYDADVWVLTETNDDLDLSDEFVPIHASDRYRPQARGRWVTLWSRLPVVERHRTDDPSRSVAATVLSAVGPVCVFGTVLPWQHDGGTDALQPAPGWAEFYRITEVQGREWKRLRDRDPSTLLVVAGDLNHNLGGPQYYGTTKGSVMLRRALAEAGLACLTEHERIPPGELDFPLIDHICASAQAGHRMTTVAHGWRRTDPSGMTLSDHSGAVAEIDLAPHP